MNYEPLHAFAERHRVPYNELCASVHESAGMAKCAECDGTGHVYGTDGSGPFICYRCGPVKHVGTVGHLHELNDSWLSKLPVGTKLYAAPAASATQTSEAERMREALQRLHAWGGGVDGRYSATITAEVMAWVGSGMVGALPPLPDWAAVRTLA